MTEVAQHTKIVIPGRDEVANLESITATVSMDSGSAPSGASRNDSVDW